jgi:hypothetical protein
MAQPTVINIYSHSSLFYWWPVWVAGLVCAVWTALNGTEVTSVTGSPFTILRNSLPGLLFTFVLLLTIFVTNVKMRGLRSFFVVVTVALVITLLAYSGLLDNVLGFIPRLGLHLTFDFYLFFSGTLLVLWLLMFFVFDRLVYWRIAEGRLTRIQVIGSGETTYDARGLTVEHRADDLLRHDLFGFGSGDVVLYASAPNGTTRIDLENVLFVHRRVQQIQRLANIEPVSTSPQA